MWDVEKKNILVLGAGKSGLAAADFLQKRGALVTLTDAKPAEQLDSGILKLARRGVRLAVGTKSGPDLKGYDYAVISPGIPLTIPLVQGIKSLNIPLIGELELAFRFSPAPMVAVTGTNGKTTTTALVGQIFQDAGLPVFVGGNIGTPLAAGLDGVSSDHTVVAEVSSFQLETIDLFHPRIAVILNITPDHLDRHGNMEGYTAAKARIFENQGPEDFTVLNYDDLRVRALAEKTRGKVIFFSREKVLTSGVYADRGKIWIQQDGNPIDIIDCNDIYIKGGHNLENALAAAAALFYMGLSPQEIARTLKTFRGVAHRLEYITQIDGILYVNDSKGTNPDATMKALEAYQEPIVLIAGGRNKGSDFSRMAGLIKEKVRTLVLVGEAAPEIKKAVENVGFTSIIEVGDFPQAVLSARQAARPGDVVMLSPACASWDMFRSYEERGDLFKSLVFDLKQG